MISIEAILENGEKVLIYKPKNFASSDNECPLILVNGKEENLLQYIMKILNDGSREAMQREYTLNVDKQEFKLKAKVNLFQTDGKTKKLIQGRGGAWCLLCSTPKEAAHNRNVILEGSSSSTITYLKISYNSFFFYFRIQYGHWNQTTLGPLLQPG